MIKKYNQFNEGISQYLKGPTQEEVLANQKDPMKLLNYSLDNNIKRGVELALASTNPKLNFLMLRNSVIEKIVKILNYNTEEIINLFNNNKYNIRTFAYYTKNKELLAYVLNLGGVDLTDGEIKDIFYNNKDVFEYICKNVENFSISSLFVDYFIDNDELENIKKVVDLKCFDMDWYGEFKIKKAIEENKYDIVKYLLEYGIKPKNIRNRNISSEIKTLLKRYNIIKEGISQYLKGPTQEEIRDYIDTLHYWGDKVNRCIENGDTEYLLKVLNENNIFNISSLFVIEAFKHNDNKTKYDMIKLLLEHGGSLKNVELNRLSTLMHENKLDDRTRKMIIDSLNEER